MQKGMYKNLILYIIVLRRLNKMNTTELNIRNFLKTLTVEDVADSVIYLELILIMLQWNL